MPVPQIVPDTGLSSDYHNELTEYTGSYSLYKLILRSNDQKDLAVNLDALKAVHLLTYTQRYPIEVYQNVVNDQNRASVAEIDHLALRINSLIELDPIQNQPVITGYINRVIKLINPRE